MAVADGAGSAAYSRLGSHVAAEWAAHAVAAALASPAVAPVEALAQGAHAAQRALAQLAERAPCDWSTAAYTPTTLPAKGQTPTGVITPDGKLHDCRSPQADPSAVRLLGEHPGCHVIAVDIHV